MPRRTKRGRKEPPEESRSSTEMEPESSQKGPPSASRGPRQPSASASSNVAARDQPMAATGARSKEGKASRARPSESYAQRHYQGRGALLGQGDSNFSVQSIFSPPRSTKSQNAPPLQATMEPSRSFQKDPFGADLDDLGSDAMLMPVGSFAEDESPPRTMEERRRASPPSHYYSHRKHPPPQMHPQERGQYHYTFGFQPKPYSWGPGYGGQAESWKQRVEPMFAPPEGKPRASPPRTSGDVSLKTPEKPPKNRGEMFRSPLMQGSPNLGTYGSFGLDTPSGVLGDDFSPMDPAFDDSLVHGDTFVTKLNFPAPTPAEGYVAQSSASDRSPMDFFGSLSPLGNPSRSPFPMPSMVHSSKSRAESATRGGVDHQQSALKDERPSQEQGAHSPLEPRRRLYSEPASSGAPMRLQLGQQSTQQRFLEGINSKMQRAHPVAPRSAPPTTAPPHARLQPHPYYGLPPHHYHQQPPFSASKPPPGAPPMQYYQIAPPQHAEAQRPLQASTSKAPAQAPAPSSFPAATSKASAEPGKENPATEEGQNPVSNRKRSPCNCKKSRCLKLYCECFSAEQFCQGCNCSDCSNTPAQAMTRDKAIKDTRSKNPQAFKPRIASTTHNMGCRCKRSECLKKYCECFQARVLCNDKCKCNGCMNRAGSQKLIDKRRKMKDTVGAEFAMREAEKAWKPQSTQRKPQAAPRRLPMASPPAQVPISSMRPSHPTPGSAGRYPPMAPHFMPYMGQAGPIGYSPMGARTMTPIHPGQSDDRASYRQPVARQAGPVPSSKAREQKERKRAPPAITPGTASASSKKSKVDVAVDLDLFGPSNPKLPKKVGLVIFGFLSKTGLNRAALVSRQWRDFTRCEELSNL